MEPPEVPCYSLWPWRTRSGRRSEAIRSPCPRLMTELAPWVGRICRAIALDQGRTR